MDPRLVSQSQKIENLIRIAKSEMKSDRIEVAANLSKLLCIQISGYLENGTTIPIEEYGCKCARKRMHRFIRHHVNKMQNPTTEKIQEFLSIIDPGWADAFLNYVKDDGRKEAIDSIMARRNQIAHGEDAGIGISTIDGYYIKCKEVIVFMNDRLIK